MFISLEQAIEGSQMEGSKRRIFTRHQRARSTARAIHLTVAVLLCLVFGGLPRPAAGQQTDLTGVWRCDDGDNDLASPHYGNIYIVWDAEAAPWQTVHRSLPCLASPRVCSKTTT
jgi:hypothetical protein